MKEIELKVLGLVFSARKRGNCLDAVKYVLGKFAQKGSEIDLVDAYNFEIKPCSHCDYECYAKELKGREEQCPVKDDIAMIYEKMRNANVVVIAVPTYGGNTSGLYRAFLERGHGIFKNESDYEQYVTSKIFGFIVIGNIPVGGDMTYHTVIYDFKDSKHPSSGILLQPREYGQVSLQGTLIKEKKVCDRLDNLVSQVLWRWEKAREEKH
jgi:multimeric flavodoxin WrbA